MASADPKQEILARTYVVLILLSILPVLITAQLARISFVEGAELRAQGEKQASSYEAIPAMRGAILDREGRVLAVNTGRYDLALDPSVAGFTSAAQQTFFDKLARLTGQSAAAYRRRLKERSSPQYVLLHRGLNEAQKEEVESWSTPGVILHAEFARRYTYGKTAAHVLGYVDADGTGIAGIELQYEEFLSGTPGRRAVKRDRLGNLKAYVGGPVVEPEHGETVVLTIDLIRQTILEEELIRGVEEAEAQWGTAIAMDPHTGAILAMGNAPTYDPNDPSAYGAKARRNHAITDRLEPGSTFKLVPAVAAIEQGVVSLDDVIDTGPGWIVQHGRTLRDSHPLGKATFEEIITQSSNIGFAMVAERMKDGTLYQYARNLGFGQPTWVDLPGEVGGKLKHPSQWSGTTKSAMSRGYEVSVTPLQMLTAYCALANGGLLVHPHIVAARRDVTGDVIWRAEPDSVRRAFEEETAQKLIPAFEQVVEEGSAWRAQIEGLRIAGKTGTAAKAVGGSYQPGDYRATFVGFFPAEDPAVALIVVLDEPRSSIYGGAASAPIFQRIASRWIGTFPKVAAHVDPAEPLPILKAVTAPNVVGQPAAVAEAQLRAAGLTATASKGRAGARVVNQAPGAGAKLDPGAQVRLSVEAAPEAVSMPDLVGLSVRQASFWLASRGVDYKIEGHGRVVSQSPEPGAPLPELALIQCR